MRNGRRWFVTVLALAAATCGMASAAESISGAAHLRHLTNPGEGWTVFTPSADTRIIYVSSSKGDDANDGLSVDMPLKSFVAAQKLLRDEYPDWLLLKRGDVWVEETLNLTPYGGKSGRSAEEPVLIASYGTEGDRPLLKSGTRIGLQIITRKELSHVAIVGLRLWGDRVYGNSKSSGIVIWGPVNDILVEDCYAHDYLDNFYPSQIYNAEPDYAPPRNIRARRCVFADAFSQGMLAPHVEGLTIDECLFDHNGFKPDPEKADEVKRAEATYNHNMYIPITANNAVVRDTITARSASVGVFCRTNGVLEGNLCLACPDALHFGQIRQSRPGGVSGRVKGNVVIGLHGSWSEERDLNAVGGYSGIVVGNINNDGAVVEDNIISRGKGAAIALGPSGVGIHNVVFRNNTVYNWVRAVNWVGEPGKELETGRLSGISFTGNLFQAHRFGDRAILRERDMGNAEGFTFEGNVYFSDGRAAEWFALKDEPRSFDQWVQISGEKDARAVKVEFADPERDAATYHATLGREATLEAFLEEARKQSKFNWRPEYTAAAVIQHVRDGFRPTTDTGGATAVPAR